MVCMGGRAGIRYVMTKFSRMDSLPNFLTHGAPLRARSARESSAIKLILLEGYFFYVNILPTPILSYSWCVADSGCRVASKVLMKSDLLSQLAQNHVTRKAVKVDVECDH